MIFAFHVMLVNSAYAAKRRWETKGGLADW